MGWKYIIFKTENMKGRYIMGMVSITRGKTAPTLHRGDVKQGQVFAVVGREGKYGTDYASIGANGRFYSVNLKTGEVASTSNSDSTVGLTGKWEFEINEAPAPSVTRECRRSEVRAGEVFKVKGQSEQLYFHLGTISRAMNGFLSVPLARTENHAVTRNGNSRVQVVATGRIKATVSG